MTTVDAVPDPGATPPRLRLNVTKGSTSAVIGLVRVAPDGSTTPVRSSVNVVGGTGSTYDYEAPYGERVTYRTVEDEPGESAPTRLSVPDVWLVHPFQPSLSVTVSGCSREELQFMAVSFMERTRPTNAAVLDVLNRDRPISQRSGRRRGSSSAMTVKTHTLEQADALGGLVDDDSPVLLNVPAALRWGVRTGWVQLGDVTDTRRDTEITDEVRLWSMPYRVVDRPEGTAAGQWLYADTSTTYAFYTDLNANYASYGDLEADIRRSA